MKTSRVVITGLGIVSPNGAGLTEFREALCAGTSGVAFQESFRDIGLGSQVAAYPNPDPTAVKQFKSRFKLRRLVSSGILYACMAGVEAWQDAGLPIIPAEAEAPDWQSGCIIGQGVTGSESIGAAIRRIDAGEARHVSGRTVQQSMSSGPSAYLGGLLGLGNQITSNSSACGTGTESILMAYDRVRLGLTDRMLAGGCDSAWSYVAGCFDVMRVLNRQHNDAPEKASRPMSAGAAGFVIGAGAGVLVVESLESAQKRGAKIYAEILGGAANSGGQRGQGSITAPSDQGIVRCIQQSLQAANVNPEDIDAINGHLTSTSLGDPTEIKSWVKALGRTGEDFPLIQSTKSMTGHCLSAAGAIECVGALLQLQHDFFHANLNCEDLHPEIEARVHRTRIPTETLRNAGIRTLVKASFGFGDVNSCVVFRKWARME